MEAMDKYDIRKHGKIIDSFDFDSLSSDDKLELWHQLRLSFSSLEKMKSIYSRQIYGKDRKGDEREFYSCFSKLKKRLEMEVMNVIVSASEGFTDYEFIKEKLDFLLSKASKKRLVYLHIKDTESSFVEVLKYSCDSGRLSETHKPSIFDKGISGSMIANRSMVQKCDSAVVFHDGKDKVTSNLISECKKGGLKLKIINI